MGPARRWLRFGAILPLFFGPLGGTCAQGPKQGFSTLRVDPGGYGAGNLGAVQGPPIDPSNGPIAGLVERDTFFLPPLLGYGGCSKAP